MAAPNDLPIEREVLRDAMLESLRKKPPGQFLTLKINTAEVLDARGLPTGDVRPGYPPQLRRADERRFREVLWSLINSGIMVQGLDAANAQWPFLSLTELGESHVEHRGPDVYDPDGYLRQLAAQHPIDQVEKRFLSQAVGAFHADLPDAAAVMLGATAEHVVVLLCEAIGRTDSAMTGKARQLADQPALKVLTFVSKYVEDRKSGLSRPLREEASTTFAGVASMIRLSRNSGGHPALHAVSRDHALVLLRLFPHFRDWAYKVIASLPL